MIAIVVIGIMVDRAALTLRNLDRNFLREGGALAMRREDRRWKIERAISPGTGRPWAHARGTEAGSGFPGASGATDATPRAEDLGAGD